MDITREIAKSVLDSSAHQYRFYSKKRMELLPALLKIERLLEWDTEHSTVRDKLRQRMRFLEERMQYHTQVYNRVYKEQIENNEK